MQTDTLTIQADARPDYTYVELEGELDALTSKQLDSYMSDLLVADTFNLVFDLSKVNYISSAGIGIFIYLYSQLSEKGKKVAIVQATPVVKDILTLLRLEEHIPILDTLDEAEDLVR